MSEPTKPSRNDPETPRRVEPMDETHLKERLQEITRRVFPEFQVGELDLRHLIHVILGCSRQIRDVYSDDRIRRIMQPEQLLISQIVDQLLQRAGEDPRGVLFRVRRLPDDVRVVGDKALFDLGLRGVRQVKGYDLEDLGSRAYRAASETLLLLAEDRRLRDFFKENRLLMLPLEDEVDFLRQASKKFSLYADILKRMHDDDTEADAEQLGRDLREQVPLMAAAADALDQIRLAASAGAAEPEPPADAYVEAARGERPPSTLLSRDQLLSAYERMVLFSSLDMERLRGALMAAVVDQAEAVETLCDEFSLYASGTRDLRKPPAYFLVGPTGVGKNHMVETLVRLLEGLWDVEVPLLTIEGPNYTYPSDINELRGATRGFIRSDEEGILTSFHQRAAQAPLSVILVDEVEKAHAQLRRFFLSILDRGTTTDNRGQELSFANSMIFFTSNLGYSDQQQSTAPIGYQDADARQERADQDVRQGLRRALSPEFMNRVRMVHFRRLTRDSADRILDLEVERIARRYRDLHHVDLDLTDRARDELLRRGFSAAFGARHLAATLERVLNVELSKKIRQDDASRPADRQELVAWLRQLRAEKAPLDLEAVRSKVMDQTRARLPYRRIEVDFRDGAFVYEGREGGSA